MPDERQDSIRQGISAPEESQIGDRAADERRREAADSRIGGGMGGTSDVDSPADDAAARAAMRASESKASPEDLEEDGPAYWNLPKRLRGTLLPPE